MAKSTASAAYLLASMFLGLLCVAPAWADTAIKWHPGVYIWPGNQACDGTARADDFATIDQIAHVPQIRGVYINWQWSCFEGDTAGDYSAGFARIDAYLAKLHGTGLHLMIGFWPMNWGACTSSNSVNGRPKSIPLPAYIINSPGFVDYCTAQSRLYTIAFWNPAAVDRIIALSAAYAARYDSNPKVEMWQPHEETAGLVGDASAGFSWAAALAQWRRLYAALATQWTHTLIREGVNFMDSPGSLRYDMDHLHRPGLIFGGADSMPETVRTIDANYAFRGLDVGTTSSPAGRPHTGWTDLRGIYPWLAFINAGEIYGTATPQQEQTYAHDTMHDSYLVWMRESWDGVPARYWPNVLPYIASGSTPVYTTACPTGWTCNTN